tara:strand:- start:896 stop:1339 length:444 start_codon:yes stop_codon:yes gene_type:complete
MYLFEPFVAKIEETTTFGYDPIYGDWCILKDTVVRLNLDDIVHILNKKGNVEGIQVIKFDDIAWKGFNLDMDKRGINCACCGGERYIHCSTRVPGILLKGVKNPEGRKYRCIDGKHRIEALLSYNMKYGHFFVLDIEDIKPYLYKIS